ncbi:MAG: alginate lyase family protein [bacterium]
MEINNLFKKYCNDFNQNFFTFDKKDLERIKGNLTNEEVKEMEVIIEEIFTYPLQSVTFDRPNFVEELDVHQYFSIGMYHHPNPDTPDGLPYIRKDGVGNPNAIGWAKGALRRVGMITNLAGLAYYLTNDKKYYELIKKHLLHFFINEETMMLPNLFYAQLIMGDPKHSKGRGSGIIDFGSHMGYGLVILKHLYNDGMIEDELYKPMQKWVSQFLNWLNTSSFGVKERTAPNNHGTMYSLIRTQLAFFTEELKDIKNDMLDELTSRLVQQIAADGSMRKELLRTRGIAYTTMNIKAFVDTYKLLDIDYSKIELLKTGFEFILPVLNKEKDITDIKILDDNGEEWTCCQMEGTYPDVYQLYLKFIGKNFGLNLTVECDDEVHYKNFFLK